MANTSTTIDAFGGNQTFIFKPIKAVAVTAGTPVAVWTPASGKRFRLLGYLVGPSVASKILFEDATGGANEFLRIPLQSAANIPTGANLGRYGYLSSAPNNALFLDVSASATLDGYVFGTEE
jgi:hypothetical protein